MDPQLYVVTVDGLRVTNGLAEADAKADAEARRKRLIEEAEKGGHQPPVVDVKPLLQE
jgi:hypothetical protein